MNRKLISERNPQGVEYPEAVTGECLNRHSQRLQTLSSTLIKKQKR